MRRARWHSSRARAPSCEKAPTSVAPLETATIPARATRLPVEGKLGVQQFEFGRLFTCKACENTPPHSVEAVRIRVYYEWASITHFPDPHSHVGRKYSRSHVYRLAGGH